MVCLGCMLGCMLGRGTGGRERMPGITYNVKYPIGYHCFFYGYRINVFLSVYCTKVDIKNRCQVKMLYRI